MEMSKEEQDYEYSIHKIMNLGLERKLAWTVYRYIKNDRKKLKEAIWQYLIDHTTIQKNGYMGAQLYYRDKNDFWKRVKARENGEFDRYDKIKKEILAAKTWGKFNKNNWGANHFVAKEGNIFEKLIVYIYEKVVQKNYENNTRKNNK